MIDKKAKKRLKEIEKEIKKLKKDLHKLELRPCQNNVELKQKEQDLQELSDKLREWKRHRIDTYLTQVG